MAPTPYYEQDGITIYHGDCLEVMSALPASDAIVTDPPYGLGFMGQRWDALPPGREWGEACLSVLKPGGHLLAFGGTRTYHRLACAVEDAGFEVRDCIAWLYGSGFPKSLDVSKAIDSGAGARREVIGQRTGAQADSTGRYGAWGNDDGTGVSQFDVTAPATPEAEQWQGWGTALKPAFEPIVVARKPLRGTVAGNVLAYGTGALNIDGCRIGMTDDDRATVDSRSGVGFGTGLTVGGHQGRTEGVFTSAQGGRWPANVALDHEAAAMLDEQTGALGSPGARASRGRAGMYGPDGHGRPIALYGDAGGASRFYYCAKASRRERGTDNIHPTVKPLALMRWLIRLVSPGDVLDPFMGSGSTLLAAQAEGRRAIGIEVDERYCEIAANRLACVLPLKAVS